MKKLPTLASIKDVQPMSQTDARLLMNLTFAALREGDPIVPARELTTEVGKRFTGFEAAFPFQVMVKRLEQIPLVQRNGEPMELRYSALAVAFFAARCDSPGEAVMYAYTLKEEALANHGEFSIHDIGRLFPRGFPTPAALEAYWDGQKAKDAPLGNRLDSAQQWMEIA